MNNPYLISVVGGMARWDIGSRTGVYKLIAELESQGKKAAIKHDRRTKLIVPVIDEHFASLPAPDITTGRNTPPSPWHNQPPAPAATPTTDAAAEPPRRKRGRPKKNPAPAAIPNITAQSVVPSEVLPPSGDR